MSLPDQQRLVKATGLPVVETHISLRAARRDLRLQDQEGRRPRLPRFHARCRRASSIASEELRLNRRLAPSLYLDVVAITGTLDAPVFGGDGTGNRIRREDAAVRSGRPAVPRARARRAHARARRRDRRRGGGVSRRRRPGRARARRSAGRPASWPGAPELRPDAGSRRRRRRPRTTRTAPRLDGSRGHGAARRCSNSGTGTASCASATATFTSATSRSSTAASRSSIASSSTRRCAGSTS